MKSLTGKTASVRGWALLLALLVGAGMIISACGEEETPAPTTPAPPPPAPAPEPEPTGPAAPGNLRVTGTTSSSITWTWDAVEGVLGYQGQFSPDATFTDTDATFLIVAPATSHTVSNLAGNTTGHFRVRSGTGTALTDLSYSDWSGGVSGTTAAPPPATALDAPDNVRSTDRSDDSITLEWDSVDDADTYEVEQREPGADWSDANCGADDADNVVDDEECVASGLDSGTDYDFRVRAVPADDDAANLVGAWSDITETRTDGTSSRPTAPTVSGGMGDLNVQWETTATGITFIWDRVPDGEYETSVLETYSDDPERCEAADVTFTARGRMTSEAVTVGRGVVRGLCVRTMDEDNRRLSFAWGVANPVVPTLAADTPTVEDGKATSMTWETINVVQDFNYVVHLVADSGRDNGMFSSTAADGIQKACDGGMRLDDGLADVTLTGLTETVDSGIKHFTGYTLCLQYSNDAGSTDWAVPASEVQTTPAAPPAPRFDRGTNNADGTTRTLEWTVPVRNSTDVPRQAAGFEAIIIHYPVRYDHDSDSDTALRGTPNPTVMSCGDSTDDSDNSWTRVTSPTLGTSLDGVTVTTPTAIAIPDNTAENLSVRLCVRATRSSAGGADVVNGPWRIGGATTITKRAPPF